MMRDASKIAPLPMRSPKIPAECPVSPLTSSDHELLPRRPTVPVLPTAPSKLNARSLRFATANISPRLISFGWPEASSSPVNITIICESLSTPEFCKAFNAYSITTSPAFISLEPVPKALLPSRRNFSPDNTVSRCPSNKIFLPFVPECSATRCPARFISSGISIHFAVKPSVSNSGLKISPTSLTPFRFCVGLSMLTTFSSSETASSLCAST